MILTSRVLVRFCKLVFYISLIVSNGALYIGNSGDRLNQITIRLQTRSLEIFSPQVSRESRLLNVLFNCWLTWSSNDQVTLLALSFGLLQTGSKLKGTWALCFWACGLFLATTHTTIKVKTLKFIQ